LSGLIHTGKATLRDGILIARHDDEFAVSWRSVVCFEPLSVCRGRCRSL
jgi:hypothetical protein